MYLLFFILCIAKKSSIIIYYYAITPHWQKSILCIYLVEILQRKYISQSFSGEMRLSKHLNPSMHNVPQNRIVQTLQSPNQTRLVIDQDHHC